MSATDLRLVIVPGLIHRAASSLPQAVRSPQVKAVTPKNAAKISHPASWKHRLPPERSRTTTQNWPLANMSRCERQMLKPSVLPCAVPSCLSVSRYSINTKNTAHHIIIIIRTSRQHKSQVKPFHSLSKYELRLVFSPSPQAQSQTPEQESFQVRTPVPKRPHAIHQLLLVP